MKTRIIVAPLALLLASVSVPALAQSCTPPTVANFGQTISFDGTSAAILFSDFFTSAGGIDPPQSTVTCDFTVEFDNANYAVYAADFDGFVSVDTDQTFELVETTPGSGDLTEIEGPYIDLYALDDAALYVVAPNAGLDLGYAINLDAGAGLDALGTLDTMDLSQVATADADDLEGSLDDIGMAAAGALTHLSGSADLLLGALKPLEGPSYVGATAAAGSFLAGVDGRFSMGGLSVLGGLAFFSQDNAASASGFLFAGAVRYVMPSVAGPNFFGEFGIWGSPNLSLAFERTYTNTGAPGFPGGLVTATSAAEGSAITVYGRAGTVLDLGPTSELVFSGTVSETWLTLDPFAEATTGGNFFAASFAGGTTSATTVKANAAWTTSITPRFDLTVLGGIGRTFGNEGLPVAIGGVALTTDADPFTFVEYGVRAGFHISDTVAVDAFILGTGGPEIGHHAQFGGSVGISF